VLLSNYSFSRLAFFALLVGEWFIEPLLMPLMWAGKAVLPCDYFKVFFLKLATPWAGFC